MRRHQSEVHSDSNREKKKCPDCEKSFTLERNLQRHVKRVHSTFFNTFKCDQCIKSFDKKENLKRHKKEVHCDEVSSCPSCGKSFKRKSNQERHSRSACKMLRKWGPNQEIFLSVLNKTVLSWEKQLNKLFQCKIFLLDIPTSYEQPQLRHHRGCNNHMFFRLLSWILGSERLSRLSILSNFSLFWICKVRIRDSRQTRVEL